MASRMVLSRLRPALLIAVAALALASTGCFAVHHGQASVLARGRVVFADACAHCHTLTGSEQGSAGGDLAIRSFTVQDFASFARIMPVKPRLSNADVHAVAEYLHAFSRRVRG